MDKHKTKSYKNPHKNQIDILENQINALDKEILEILLIDQTTKKNILWCTDFYSKNGQDYTFKNSIQVNLITGKNGRIIKPRVEKSMLEKKKRIKENAEVFTASWACNHQNNIIDELWFSRKNVFNFELKEMWECNPNKIIFEKKTWNDYVLDTRIEITCGEAPYLISRYDTVSGKLIDINSRIGILDRKIRVINENFNNDIEWLEWVKKAYQSVYAYEWQGDSLLIARENLLYTFIDYYEFRFNAKPTINILKEIAFIISWNIWQMDGLKGVIPLSCDNEKVTQLNLFGEPLTEKCKGCEAQNIFSHNGIYCEVKDWVKGTTEKFVNLFHGGKLK
jgi:hypothetical protein